MDGCDVTRDGRTEGRKDGRRLKAMKESPLFPSRLLFASAEAWWNNE